MLDTQEDEVLQDQGCPSSSRTRESGKRHVIMGTFSAQSGHHCSSAQVGQVHMACPHREQTWRKLP